MTYVAKETPVTGVRLGTMTIVEFLTARLDEDEAVALAAKGHPLFDGTGIITGRNESVVIGSHLATHIARHAPDHVLADIAAKRAILDLHQPFSLDTDPVTGCKTCSYRNQWDELQIQWPCPTVRLLASVYAEHPSYRREWKP
jgi:hypothetical protein